MIHRHDNKALGFTLVEVLVSAIIFTFIMIAVSQLFVNSLDLQQRAAATQKIQENAQFVIESIAREVRVSKVTDSSPTTLTIEHPANGVIVYRYQNAGAYIEREVGLAAAERITSGDVQVAAFSFLVQGAGPNDEQARVTMPMTLEATVGRQTVQVSLQTTVTSRNVFDDLTRP